MAKSIDNIEYISSVNTLIGTKRKELVDIETGERILVDQINKMAYGTKNFWKCYLMDFLAILGIMDSKQLDVFVYIIENTQPSNNLFIGTYDKICRDTNVSRPTVANIMKKLQTNNFIKRVQNGLWLVNPDILVKGNENKRQILISYYQSDEPIDKITQNKQKKKSTKTEQPQQSYDSNPTSPAGEEWSDIYDF